MVTFDWYFKKMRFSCSVKYDINININTSSVTHAVIITYERVNAFITTVLSQLRWSLQVDLA